MNCKRLALSGVLVFVFIFIYEWIFHGMILGNIYQDTASLWRPEADMENYFIWLTAGQLLFAVMFCLIFLKGYENKGWQEGARYGLMMGVMFCAPNLIFYAVQPLPAMLVIYWCIGGVLEAIIAGVLLAVSYQAKT